MFPKEQMDQKEQKEQKVKRKGKVKLENAEEKLFKSATNERLGRCDMPFPTLDPSLTQWRENAKHLHKYYAYFVDLEQLTRADRSIGKKDFDICYDTNDSKCHAEEEEQLCTGRCFIVYGVIVPIDSLIASFALYSLSPHPRLSVDIF